MRTWYVTEHSGGVVSEPGGFELASREAREDSDAIIGASADIWRESVRVALVIAELFAQEAARRQQQRWEQQREAAAQKIWEDRQRAEPILRATYDEKFWENPTPEDIGRAWHAAQTWAPSDPKAEAALDNMRTQLEKYGFTPSEIQLNVADLSKALALGAPDLRRAAEIAREDAVEFGENSHQYVIRDPEDPEKVLHEGVLQTVPGEHLKAAAARELKQWAEENDHTLDANLGIELVANDGTTDITSVLEVTGDDAEQLIQDEEEWQQKLIDGELKGSLDEVLATLDRTEEAASLLGEGADGYEALQEASNRLRIQVAAVEAEVRGEDPRYTYQAADLRSSLENDEWWDTATASEVAGIWSKVCPSPVEGEHEEGKGAWPEGLAKQEMTQLLQKELFVRHGLDLEPDVPAEDVAALLGDAETGTPAATYNARAAKANEQAIDLYAKSYDASQRADRLMEEAEEIVSQADPDFSEAGRLREEAMTQREQAALYRVQAKTETSNAAQLSETAGAHANRWGDIKIPDATLREEFEKRYERPPDPAAREPHVAAPTDEATSPAPGAPAPEAASEASAEIPAPTPVAAPEASTEPPAPSPPDLDAEGSAAVNLASAAKLPISRSPSASRRRTRQLEGAIPGTGQPQRPPQSRSSTGPGRGE